MRAFVDRLNHCLNEMDAPNNLRERAAILSKVLDIPKPDARALLEGHQRPDPTMLEKIASEFEVDVNWLTGDK